MIVGKESGLTGGNLAAAAFQTAAEPEKIVFLPGDHFAASTGDGVHRNLRRRPRLVQHLAVATAG